MPSVTCWLQFLWEDCAWEAAAGFLPPGQPQPSLSGALEEVLGHRHSELEHLPEPGPAPSISTWWWVSQTWLVVYMQDRGL